MYSVHSIVLATSIFLLALSLHSQEISELNSQADDYGPIIYPDGSVLIFQSKRSAPLQDSNFWQAQSSQQNSRLVWKQLKLATFSTASKTSTLNSEGFEGGLAILFDQSQKNPIEIFFASVADSKTQRSGFAGINLYHSQALPIENNKSKKWLWSPSTQIDELSSEFDDHWPTVVSIEKNGVNIMIFASNRPGGFGGYDLWMSQRSHKDTLWSEPVNLGSRVNSAYNEITPTFSIDAKFFVFSSDRPNGGHGGYDLYSTNEISFEQAFTKNKKYFEKNIKVMVLPFPYNTSANEEAPTIANGKYLLFSSDRILRRGLGQGFYNLYSFGFPITGFHYASRTTVTFRVVTRKGSKKKLVDIPAFIEVRSKNTRSLIALTESNANPLRTFDVQKLNVQVWSRGYQTLRTTLDLSNVRNKQLFKQTYILQPLKPLPSSSENDNVDILDSKACQQENLECLQKIVILFELNQAQVRTIFKESVKLAAKILNRYKNKRVSIIGHTDRSGPESYNRLLSLRRSQAVQKELLDAGVSSQQLEVLGVGESRLPEKWQEDRYAHLQRRVTFEVRD